MEYLIKKDFEKEKRIASAGKDVTSVYDVSYDIALYLNKIQEIDDIRSFREYVEKTVKRYIDFKFKSKEDEQIKNKI